MIGFLDGQGFLGANASMGADLSLVLTAVSVVLLTIGWRLAVGKRYGRWKRRGFSLDWDMYMASVGYEVQIASLSAMPPHRCRQLIQRCRRKMGEQLAGW